MNVVIFLQDHKMIDKYHTASHKCYTGTFNADDT